MDDEEVRYAPSYQFRPIALVITTLSAFSSWIDDVVELLCAHANWKNDRAAVANEMRSDIERIVSGE